MKISKVEAFLVRWGDIGRPVDTASASATAVVAIHADGMVGLGEASPMQNGVASLAVIARDMAPTLVGSDVLDHAVTLDRLQHKLIKLGPDGIVTGAIAAVDIALWDLKGKAFRQPIYKLLGGAWRTRLPFYASIGGNAARDVDGVVKTVEARLKADYSGFRSRNSRMPNAFGSYLPRNETPALSVAGIQQPDFHKQEVHTAEVARRTGHDQVLAGVATAALVGHHMVVLGPHRLKGLFPGFVQALMMQFRISAQQLLPVGTQH